MDLLKASGSPEEFVDNRSRIADRGLVQMDITGTRGLNVVQEARAPVPAASQVVPFEQSGPQGKRRRAGKKSQTSRDVQDEAPEIPVRTKRIQMSFGDILVDIDAMRVDFSGDKTAVSIVMGESTPIRKIKSRSEFKVFIDGREYDAMCFGGESFIPPEESASGEGEYILIALLSPVS